MKKLLPLSILFLLLLTSCGNWIVDIPNIPSPFPSATPKIFSPTPRIVTPTKTPAPEIATLTETPMPTETPLTPTETLTATSTESPPITATETETATPTATETPTTTLPGSLSVEVLGCNTSIDITHGMGEVTNAFVLLKNNSGSDLTNLCATLSALDEGRQHPDKTVCVPLLANGYQVSLKLTVDSTFQEETPIQVDVTSEGNLLAREGQASCRDIGLFAPPPASLLTPTPIP